MKKTQKSDSTLSKTGKKENTLTSLCEVVESQSIKSERNGEEIAENDAEISIDLGGKEPESEAFATEIDEKKSKQAEADPLGNVIEG
jgi:23S rRNA pseudoU1915 N3-methylase RlmH